MARKSIQTQMFKTGNLSNTSENKKNFCMNLYDPRRLNTLYDNELSQKVTYVGKGHLENILHFQNCVAYNKCTYDGTVYHSTKYSRVKKTDDTVIQLKDDTFAIIFHF